MRKNYYSVLATAMTAIVLYGTTNLLKSQFSAIQVDCPGNISISPTDALDSSTGLYNVSTSDIVTNINETSLCLVRAVDFDAGPIVDPSGDTLEEAGIPLYNYRNVCQADGDRTLIELNAAGEIINTDTVLFVLCKETIGFCASEGEDTDVVIIESDSSGIIDMCRVDLQLFGAVSGGGDMNMNMCSASANDVVVRLNYNDIIDGDTIKDQLLFNDSLFTINLSDTPEITAAGELWDINFIDQGLEFLWNSTQGLDSRTLQAGTSYQFFFDFGQEINFIQSIELDESLQGRPTISNLGQNVIFIDFEEGVSIGPEFNVRIYFNLQDCDPIRENTMMTGGGGGGVDTSTTGGGGVDTMMTGGGGVDTMMTGGGGVDTSMTGGGGVDTMTTGGGGVDTMTTGGGGVDTMMTGGGGVDTMITGGGDLKETGFLCDQSLSFDFDIEDLADTSFQVTEFPLPSETGTVLNFDLSGNNITTDSIVQIDSIVSQDSTFIPDTVLVVNTQTIIDSTLVIDTTISSFDTITRLDTIYQLDTTGFSIDSMLTFDSTETVVQEFVFTETIVRIDSIITRDSMEVLDSIFRLDSMLIVNERSIIDSTLSLDTIFMIDSIYLSDSMLVIDSSVMPPDSMVVLDSVLASIDTSFTLDSIFMIDTLTQLDSSYTVTQGEFLGVDSLTIINDIVTLDTTSILDSVLVDRTILSLDTMVLTDTIYQLDTLDFTTEMNTVIQAIQDFDSTYTTMSVIVTDSMFVPDSVITIVDVFAGIDSVIVLDTIVNIGTISVFDTTFMLDTTLVVDSMLTIDSVVVSVDTLISVDTSQMVVDNYNLDSTVLMIDSMMVIDSTFDMDSMLVVDTLTVFDTTFMIDSTLVSSDTVISVDTMLTFNEILDLDTFYTVFNRIVMDSVPTVTETMFPDTMINVTSTLVLDSIFTQDSIINVNGMFTFEDILTIDTSLIFRDFIDADAGDTICGSLRSLSLIGINEFSYNLSWDPQDYEFIGCSDGTISALGCDITNSSVSNGFIDANYFAPPVVNISQETVLAEYCYLVLRDDIETPDPFTLTEEFENSRVQLDSSLVVTTAISLADFGILPFERITQDDGRTVEVNRCLTYSANFDRGQLNVGNTDINFIFAEGCAVDRVSADGTNYVICRETLEVCCNFLGTKEISIVSYTTANGVIDECRYPVTIADNTRFCDQPDPFPCSASVVLEATDIDENADGTYSLNKTDLGVADNDDYCVLRTVDFEAGPITLFTGQQLVIGGNIAYHSVNDCGPEDQIIDQLLDPSGNVMDQRTIQYVLCKPTVDLCCEELSGVDITVVTQLRGKFITDCQTTVVISDSSITLECNDVNVDCAEELDEEQYIPNIMGTGLCSSNAELSVIEDLSALDTCGIGMGSRLWFVDVNGNGELDNNETRCDQTLVVAGGEAFDPALIRWPAHRNGTSLAGVRLTCNADDQNVESIFLGGEVVCSATELVGNPTWCETSCQLIGTSTDYENINEDGNCVGLRAVHTVIDWCTYTSLGRPNDGVLDADPGNFEAVEDLRDGCEECAGNGSTVYLRYKDGVINRDGIYRYSQIINLDDDSEPVINAPDTVVVSTSRRVDQNGQLLLCEGIDTVRATASDLCFGTDLEGELTWRVRVRNWIFFPVPDENGLAEYNFTGNEVAISTRTGEEGFLYFITFDVTDACGNSASHTTFVQFDDVTPPEPECLSNAPVVQVSDSTATIINASDFNIGSFDNCTLDGSLRYSLTRQGQEPISPASVDFGSQTTYSVTCNNIPLSRRLTLWVWDLSRNGAPCDVELQFQSDCVGTADSLALIAGGVFTPRGQAVTGVDVRLETSDTGDDAFPKSRITEGNGLFDFNNNFPGLDYTLSATLDSEILNGLTTLDLVLIQKHIIGTEILDSPYKIIAADADGGGSVSVSDIITFRNIIVGNISEFPNNKDSWVVIPDGGFFNDESPFPFTESIGINNLQGNAIDQNFIAVKVGDVNYTASTSGFDRSEVRSGQSIDLRMANSYVKKGQELTIPVSIPQAQDMFGLQFGLEHNGLELRNISSDLVTLASSNYSSEQNVTLFSWNDKDAISELEGFINLQFVATQEGYISDMISLTTMEMTNEAYQGSDLLIHPIELVFDDAIVDEFSIAQNQPNPFTEKTNIQFYIPVSGNVKMTVLDMTGKLIYSVEQNYPVGKNVIQLNSDELNGHGVLYYQIQYDDQVKTEKMILLK